MGSSMVPRAWRVVARPRLWSERLHRSLSSNAPPVPIHELPLLTIVGAPNAGKSTLFNRIVHAETSFASFRPRALVSPQPGTTRDRLESVTEWDGVRFRVYDTGGIHTMDEHARRAGETMEREVERQVTRTE